MNKLNVSTRINNHLACIDLLYYEGVQTRSAAADIFLNDVDDLVNVRGVKPAESDGVKSSVTGSQTKIYLTWWVNYWQLEVTYFATAWCMVMVNNIMKLCAMMLTLSVLRPTLDVDELRNERIKIVPLAVDQ